VEKEQAKGRVWNGYVCPGCRNVFRVAADFAGDEVMCPSCQETLRLPKKPGDAPPSSAPVELTPPAPAPRTDETQIQAAADQPAWRALFASPGGRKKLSLALGIPLLLVAVVLMFLPADETADSQSSPAPQPDQAVLTGSPETAAPQPGLEESQIAGLTPDVRETEALPEPPPPALPGEADPALLAKVADDPAASDPQVPAPIDPEHGLVDALPAIPPVAPPPGEIPAPPGEADEQLPIPGATPPATAEPPAAAEESTSPPVTRHHTVVRGDTLSRIARKYDVDSKAIMRANGMKNDVVRLGAKLVIPPAGP
jgi:hypothetical protein